MFNCLSENLNMLMSKARLSSSELARHINIPAATIKRIRNNEQANPTIATLLPIANYFSISLSQLIGAESLDMMNQSQKRAVKIPKLLWNECLNYSLLDLQKVTDWAWTEKNVTDNAFALEVENQDLGLFPRGCLLIIETKIEPKTNDYVLVANTKHQITSIREYIIEIDQIYLKPLVPGLGISTLTTELKIIGVIIQYKVDLQ